MSSFYIKPSIKNAIRLRDNSECCYCGKYVPKKARTLDHVHPQARGGADTPDNLVLACRTCNSRKGMKTLKQFTADLVFNGVCSQASALNIHKRVYRRLSTSV